MIWLASFPRSGNTFFRNILYEVYGIPSSAYHPTINLREHTDYLDYEVVKTHLLPHQLPEDIQDCKSVCIIRDARDALVSIAHHRKDLIAPDSDFEQNLEEAIIAAEGSHFGGWTENTRQWVQKADIVIFFEDLVKDPIGEVEKLRAIIDLPPPNPDKLPTFEQLKFGDPKYGGKNKGKKKDRTKKLFRKGKVGGWKEELPLHLEQLIYEIHGEQMTRLGYELRGVQEEENKYKRFSLAHLKDIVSGFVKGINKT